MDGAKTQSSNFFVTKLEKYQTSVRDATATTTQSKFSSNFYRPRKGEIQQLKQYFVSPTHLTGPVLSLNKKTSNKTLVEKAIKIK